MTGTASGVTLDVSQNKYLASNQVEMHAVVTVTAHRCGPAPPAAAEVILIDCSGSMEVPPSKIEAARRAAAAAIDQLRDGVHFAVVAGTERARMVYPPDARMVPADPRTRAEASREAEHLAASGGTALGQWLLQALRLLEQRPAAIQHAVMLTDGRERHETPEELTRVLAKCAGRFVCDAWGIGEDWDPKELLRIADTLRGSAQAVREDSDVVAGFQRTMRTAMGKAIADLRIRVTTTPGTRLRHFGQTHPKQSDLTGYAVAVDERTVEFSTGSWGDEKKEYHLVLAVDGREWPRGEDAQAARVELIVDAGPPVAPEPVLVHLTGNRTLSTLVPRKVSHALAQEQLNRAVLAGCEALDAGDRSTATQELGRAVRLATEAGNEAVLADLRRLVDIDDARTGRVRLRADWGRPDLLALYLSSVVSAPSPDPPDPPDGGQESGGRDRSCAGCGYVSPPGSTFCARCGQKLDPERSP